MKRPIHLAKCAALALFLVTSAVHAQSTPTQAELDEAKQECMDDFAESPASSSCTLSFAVVSVRMSTVNGVIDPSTAQWFR